MTAFQKTLLVLTIAGTLCGLFLVLLRKLAKGKIPSSFLYFAWIVVILRFAIPIAGLIPIGTTVPHVDPVIPSYTEPQPFYTDTEIMVVPSAYSHTDVPTQPVQNQSVTEQFTPVAKKNVSFPTILFIVWCCGTTGFLLWNIISYARFRSLMEKELSRPSCHDVDLYDAVYSARKPNLRRSRVFSTPLTFGIVNPVLVIPDSEYEDVTLKNVFQHEIIHFRRHDILLKWFSLIVFSAHWFNPFVWYFRKEIDRVCELSCDETLLRKMNADEKRRYGETLLKIAEGSCTAPSRMIIGFSEGKKDLKERLMQIMSFKEKTKAAIAVALVPILVLCGCAVALGPKAEAMPDADSIAVSNVDELIEAIAPNTEIHLASGTYIHDREMAAKVVCIITDAYFKGLLEIKIGYIAQNSPLRDADEIKTYDGSPTDIFYDMGNGDLVSCALSYPPELIKNLNFIEGLDDIGDNEPDGNVHQIKVHYWKQNTSTGEFEKNVLEIELIREDGYWRVVRF